MLTLCKSRPKSEITTLLVFYPFRKTNNDTIEGNATGFRRETYRVATQIHLAQVYPLRNNRIIRQRRSIKSVSKLRVGITLTHNLIRISHREYPATFRVEQNSNSYKRWPHALAPCNYEYRMADRGRVIGNVTRKLLFPSGSLPVRTYQFSTYQLQFLSNFILLAIDVFDFPAPEFSVTFSSLDLPLNTLFNTLPIPDFVNFLRSIERKAVNIQGFAKVFQHS